MKFIGFIVGFYPGMLLGAYIMALSILVTIRIMNLMLVQVRIFGKRGSRESHKEDMKWYKDKFILYPLLVYKDFSLLDKYDTSTPEMMKAYLDETDKRRKIANFSTMGFVGVMASFYIVVICNNFWYTRSFLAGFLMGSCFGLLLYLFLSAKSVISYNNSNNLALRREINRLDKELLGGATYSQLESPISRINDKGVTKDVKLSLLYVAAMKAILRNDNKGLSNTIREIDTALRKNGMGSEFKYEPMFCDYYYLILYFSSFVNVNGRNAFKIYNVIKNTLENDISMSGRRTLAYYQFCIMKKPELAAITISQAEEALLNADRETNYKAQLEMEHFLIEQLRDYMTKILNPDLGRGGFRASMTYEEK